ncbi:MAG: tetratricopeptide repeat protein [Pseudomonadota bacterium]|nr:tetratricopeptide repeat protein [Pseudomonadota bacterium]
MDRNQLEQEAMRQLNLGSQEGALRAYSAILKLDPRDRRIRQKVGELLLKLGRPVDAEKQFREVADGLVKEGAHRAAVALLKQLVTLRPDDPGLQMDLAECYVASGYANDARPHFDMAMRLWIGAGRALDAAKAARRVAEQCPGEPPLRLKVAELLEAGGDVNGAALAYQEVAEEYRRRGRPDEVGRIAEMALRLKPDDVSLLLDAASGRIDANDHKRALAHLQVAFNQAPREPRTLDLLARAFEGVGQGEKALKVLSELSRVAADRGNHAAEADALRRASRLSPADIDIQERLVAAEEKVSRMERRLTQLTLAQPATEDELRDQVRAEVYLRYGFLDRAEATLREALVKHPNALGLLAAIAEVEIVRERPADGLLVMERLLPRAGAEAGAVQDRMAVVRARFGLSATPVAPAVAGPATRVAQAPVTSAPAGPAAPRATSAEARGDALAAAGDLPGAMVAFREALGEDPLNDGVLTKIASLRGAARAAAAPPPAPLAVPPIAGEDDAFADFAPLDDGTFAEVLPEDLPEELPDALSELLEPAPDSLDEPGPGLDIDEARSLVAVGMWSDALAMLEGVPTLDAAVLRAQSVRGQGDVGRALDLLRESVNDAQESDPAYADALFELSALYTATSKVRAAIRLLEELKDLEPTFRVGEVESRMRGLQKLLK